MTLGFSTKWPKQMGALAAKPNYFVAKIWMSLNCTDKKKLHEYYSDDHVKKLDAHWDVPDSFIFKKIHSIRSGNRWREGMFIHPVVNNRTKKRFQFAPLMICYGVQEFEIKYFDEIGKDRIAINLEREGKEPILLFFSIYVAGKSLRINAMEVLAINDGFDNLESFLLFFNKDFKGQIIHWTDDVRY